LSRDAGNDAEGLRPGFRRALAASVGLSILFIVVYSATNWITSQRSDVGTWYYAWERYIPFVPVMIIPYLSIDLFFVAAPFLCSHRQELNVLSRRIALAIVLAGACFLLFPLTLAVERQHADGWLGAVFDWFRGMDLPYNLLPSLHIALRTLLADLYARHTGGAARWASHAWFSLIGLSTLLTYQHHVVDIAGGFVLAAVCFYAVRAESRWPAGTRNTVVGGRYAICSAALAMTGVLLRPWGWWLLWPAVSTGLAAAGYFNLGPGVYGKQDGRLLLSTRVVMGPLLAAQFLSYLYYRPQCRRSDAVNERVWIGRRLTNGEAAEAVRGGVVAAVDLTDAFSEARVFREIPHLAMPILDLTAPSTAQLDEAVAFINEHNQRGIVYVHCKIGYSRSAAVVGAWLLASGRASTVDEALQHLRSVRPTIIIRPEAEMALRRFAGHQGSPTEVVP